MSFLGTPVRLGPWRRLSRVLAAAILVSAQVWFVTRLNWSGADAADWTLLALQVPLTLAVLMSALAALSGRLVRVRGWTVPLAAALPVVAGVEVRANLPLVPLLMAGAGSLRDVARAGVSLPLIRPDSVVLGPFQVERRPRRRVRWVGYPDVPSFFGVRRPDSPSLNAPAWKSSLIAGVTLIGPLALLQWLWSTDLPSMLYLWDATRQPDGSLIVVLDGWHPLSQAFGGLAMATLGVTLANLAPVSNPGDPWTDMGQIVKSWSRRAPPVDQGATEPTRP